MSRCPDTCPECRGRGELVLLTSKVPCSQPWRGGKIPLSGVSAFVQGLPTEVKDRMAESFRESYPGVKLLSRMASVDGEAFRREYQGDFVSRLPKSAKETLALQCQNIVERHGGSSTIVNRGSRECVVHVELDGERFEDVSTNTLRKIFYMHHGSGARAIADALREARGRPTANLQRWPTNPCAEIWLGHDELLFLGGPRHGQFLSCPLFGRFQTYGEDRHKANPFRPSRIEHTSEKIYTYIPKTVSVGDNCVRVMIHEGDDLKAHMSFLMKLHKLFEERLSIPPGAASDSWSTGTGSIT